MEHPHQTVFSLSLSSTMKRVLKFDTKTRKTTVLMKNLRLPNGVQLSQDKQSLLVCELSSRRVLRYDLFLSV